MRTIPFSVGLLVLAWTIDDCISCQHQLFSPDCVSNMNSHTSKSVYKTVYLIRHAESNENLFYNAARRTWGRLMQCSLPVASDFGTTLMLPFVMFNKNTTDAEVSQHGRKQIQQLRQTVTDDDFMFVTDGAEEKDHLLVVHSPLKRAKQTAYGIIKGFDVHEIDTRTDGAVEFEELECLREINPKEIIKHGNKALDKRISVFEDWIKKRKESHIAVIGHSIYFQRMLQLPRPFSNCDVWELKFTPGIAEEHKPPVPDPQQVEDDMEAHTPPRSWHSMKLMYRYTPDGIFDGLL